MGVLHDGCAYRTRVGLRLRGFDEVEVAGLSDGDQVVVSGRRDCRGIEIR